MSAMSPAQREYVDMISRSGEYLLQLINDVLEMSKIEAGRVTLNIESFDLYHMLASLEEMLKVRASSKGLYLLFERSERVPHYLRTDESKLRQVLINLISNGIKFTRQGGITVRIDYTGRRAAAGRGAKIRAWGSNGPNSAVCSIFSPRPKSGQEAHEGTGLGLPISRRFVRLDGRRDHACRARSDKGSVFTFDIHAEPADSRARAQ